MRSLILTPLAILITLLVPSTYALGSYELITFSDKNCTTDKYFYPVKKDLTQCTNTDGVGSVEALGDIKYLEGGWAACLFVKPDCQGNCLLFTAQQECLSWGPLGNVSSLYVYPQLLGSLPYYTKIISASQVLGQILV